jgi:bifunctional non-homologous end joining protein LigD
MKDLVQLATLVDDVPEGDEWIHEIKLDGIRLVAHRDGDAVELRTRSGLDWTASFGPIAAALRRLRATRLVLDGEAVVFGPDGKTVFQALQGGRGGADDPTVYVAFDLLELDGRDLRAEPLEERKRRLTEVLAGAPTALRLSEHVRDGAALFADACRRGLEGIVSKRSRAPYVPGRSREWLKIKCTQRQELVIGGFTDPAGSRVGFGALLLGAHDAEGRLRYAGKVGTGFGARLLVELRERLVALEQESSPFAGERTGAGRGVHFVKPDLVAEIAYAELTRDGLVRHGRFVGLRADKAARDVVLERPAERVSSPPARARRASTGKSGPGARGGRRRATRATRRRPLRCGSSGSGRSSGCP